jgi:hypothetical protein
VFVDNPLIDTSMVLSNDRMTERSPLFNFYSTRYREAYKTELLELFNDSRTVIDHSAAHWCCEQVVLSLQSQNSCGIARGPEIGNVLFSGFVFFVNVLRVSKCANGDSFASHT